MGNDDNLRAIS